VPSDPETRWTRTPFRGGKSSVIVRDFDPSQFVSKQTSAVNDRHDLDGRFLESVDDAVASVEFLADVVIAVLGYDSA